MRVNALCPNIFAASLFMKYVAAMLTSFPVFVFTSQTTDEGVDVKSTVPAESKSLAGLGTTTTRAAHRVLVHLHIDGFVVDVEFPGELSKAALEQVLSLVRPRTRLVLANEPDRAWAVLADVSNADLVAVRDSDANVVGSSTPTLDAAQNAQNIQAAADRLKRLNEAAREMLEAKKKADDQKKLKEEKNKPCLLRVSLYVMCAIDTLQMYDHFWPPAPADRDS